MSYAPEDAKAVLNLLTRRQCQPRGRQDQPVTPRKFRAQSRSEGGHTRKWPRLGTFLLTRGPALRVRQSDRPPTPEAEKCDA